jgi:hypothetical protein
LSWNQQFFDPIELPGGRKLVTLRSTLSAAREMSVTGPGRVETFSFPTQPSAMGLDAAV